MAKQKTTAKRTTAEKPSVTKRPQGRPHGTKGIKDAEQLWSLFEAYKKYTKANPRKIQDFVGKDANEVTRLKEEPLTMQGFENYVSYLPGMPVTLDQYFSNKDNRYSEYIAICTRIRREIQNDQVSGGLVGIYNPAITARLNGLADVSKIDHTSKGEKISTDIDYSKLSDETLKAIEAASTSNRSDESQS